MNQFVVPQFIDVEDKIFGPVTTRQFLILLAAGLLVFISYRLADTALFIFCLAVIGGLALVLAFVKINGQPFHFFLLNLFENLRKPSLRVWNRVFTRAELQEMRQSSQVEVAEHPEILPRVTHNRLRDLSLIVNTGGYYKPE